MVGRWNEKLMDNKNIFQLFCPNACMRPNFDILLQRQKRKDHIP